MHAPPSRSSTSPATLKTRSPPPPKPVLLKLFFKNPSPCKISPAKFAKSSAHPPTKGCVGTAASAGQPSTARRFSAARAGGWPPSSPPELDAHKTSPTTTPPLLLIQTLSPLRLNLYPCIHHQYN